MTDQETMRRTRRAVLGAALGGAAAVAAGSLRPLEVRAADGGNALLGQANESTAQTSFENTDPGEPSLVGIQASGGIGVVGSSIGGAGVHGSSDGKSGVWGTSGEQAGVWGSSGEDSLATVEPGETGVYGYANTSIYSNGVWGDSIDGAGLYGTGYYGLYALGGIAVQGDSGPSGVGVYGWTGNAAPPTPSAGVGVYARAETNDETALQVVGKLKFNRSGTRSMKTSRKTFPYNGMTSSSQVFAVLQTNRSGVYIRSVKPQRDQFTVRLSKSPGKKVTFSFIVING